MNSQQLQKLETAKAHAKSKAGVCLSVEYINNKEKMIWKCFQEHPQWEASYDNIINKNSWCLHCSGKNKKDSSVGLKEAQEHALIKGGQCLSNNYESRQKNLEWKCSNAQHKSWVAPTDTVIYKNTWCKDCGFEQQKSNKKDKIGLQKAQEYAKVKGGQCVSTQYVNQNTNLEWKCSNLEHSSWWALPKISNRRTWCRQCTKEKFKVEK